MVQSTPLACARLREKYDTIPSVDEDVKAFFERNSFHPSTRNLCDEFAKSKYALAKAEPSPYQGYCSYTLRLPGEHLLQFRPRSYSLDTQICDQARTIFPSLTPMTVHVGTVEGPSQSKEGHVGNDILEAYLQREMPGMTLTEFRQSQTAVTEREKRKCRHRLVEDMAAFFATSFRHRRYPSRTGEEFPRGKIGNSLRGRLGLLEGLPKSQEQAKKSLLLVKDSITAIETEIPWCLTHGDLVPANIMVNQRTGGLSGLIDWAEGEWLPFGVGLYGVEELFGETNGEGDFEFYPDHEDLRSTFWRSFLQITQPYRAVLPNRWLRNVRLCRALGILLWRGIAFDDGRLDRVVDEEKDAAEMRKLELFFEAPEPLEDAGWKWRVELAWLCVGRYLSCMSGGWSAKSTVKRDLRLKQDMQSPSIKARDSWRETA